MKLRLGLAAIAALLVAGQASAQGFACSVNPGTYLGLGGDGTVVVSVNNSPRTIVICSVSQTLGGVTSEGCSGWYATLLTMRSLSKSGVIYFDSANPANQGLTSCDQFLTPDWTVRIPYHIGL